MSSTLREPEEMDSEFVAFDQPVNEKAYSRASSNFTEEQLTRPIPDIPFERPPLSSVPPTIETEMPKSEAKKEPTQPFNAEMNEMKQKEKEEAAKHVTEVVLSGYEMLHQWANKSIRFSERKMQKLERDGEIDFSVKIPIDARGNLVEAREFINEFNDTNAEILKVSESFKEEVRPVMTRVLAKKGVGMTDEQRLLWLFGKDIGMKATLIYSVMSQRKEILNHLKEYTANNRTASQPSNSYQESHTETHKATVVEPVVVEEFDETHDRAYDGEAYVSNEAPTAKDIVDGMVNPK